MTDRISAASAPGIATRYAARVNVERLPLGTGYAELRRLSSYIRIDEHGDPASADETTRYFATIERAMLTHGVDAMLIVAQIQAPNALSPHWKPIREARWEALSKSRARKIAVVVDNELALARIKMSALAAKAPVRAFVDENSALGWLRAPK